VDNDEEYARLVASLQTSRQRPLSPIQTASLVERIVNEEGMEEAVLLLSVGKDMLSYFIRLKTGVPEQCHGAVLWGASNDLGVGFSAAHHIAALQDEEDKIALFSIAYSEKLGKEDIKKITSIKKKNSISIQQAFEDYMKITAPKIITKYMVVLAITDETVKKIEELARENDVTSHIMYGRLVKERFGLETVEGSRIKGHNAAFTVNESEFGSYQSKIRDKGLRFDHITKYIVSGNE